MNDLATMAGLVLLYMATVRIATVIGEAGQKFGRKEIVYLSAEIAVSALGVGAFALAIFVGLT